VTFHLYKIFKVLLIRDWLTKINWKRRFKKLFSCMEFCCRVINRYYYYPTLLRRVQITRETSTNITRYLYSSHSPDRAKDKKPWQVRIMEKRKRWIINLLLDILVCSIAVNFYSLFVFWLALRAHQNTAINIWKSESAWHKNIRYYTLKRLIRYMYYITLFVPQY